MCLWRKSCASPYSKQCLQAKRHSNHPCTAPNLPLAAAIDYAPPSPPPSPPSPPRQAPSFCRCRLIPCTAVPALLHLHAMYPAADSEVGESPPVYLPVGRQALPARRRLRKQCQSGAVMGSRRWLRLVGAGAQLKSRSVLAETVSGMQQPSTQCTRPHTAVQVASPATPALPSRRRRFPQHHRAEPGDRQLCVRSDLGAVRCGVGLLGRRRHPHQLH